MAPPIFDPPQEVRLNRSPLFEVGRNELMWAAAVMKMSRTDHSSIEQPGQSAVGHSGTPTGLPRLWLQLPVETQRQLAQQIARLLQRVQLTPPHAMEGHRAEHGNIG